MELYELTIHELREKFKEGEAACVDATESVLSRIEAVEPKVKAYLTVTADEALEAARTADQAIRAGEDKPLLGVPVGGKDIFLIEGVQTTAGSKILEGFIPTYDSTSVAKLKDAGAVIVGKLNLDEFAMGSSTENSAYQVTHNPWDLDRIPGGSSGGSAAAVAAGECIGSLGTDTGGSIRQPAACCGVVGIKPTYGRVSRYGVIAFASSLDQVGPIARDVRDAAIMLNVLAGFDPLDSTSVQMEVPDYTAVLGREIKGMKIGLPKEYFATGLDPEVEAAVREAVKALEGLGAEVSEVSLPHTEYCVATYYIIAPAEASSNLARYDGVRYALRDKEAGGLVEMYKKTRDQGFGAEVKRRILIGTYTLSAGYYDAYYKKAGQVRTLIKRDYDEAFEKFDVLVAPAMPTPPFKLGEKMDDPLAMYLSDILTLSCNMAGLPGMSVPCGFTKSGLPIGMQIFAKHFNEEAIFRLAYAYEQATEWTKKKPSL
jgi:aspartyl-tRNA(Asn)/glutamyl-tRNA(Gln) amidotransferase subunit A